MDKAKTTIKRQKEAMKNLKKFLEKAAIECNKKGLKLEKAYLIGSRARGDYLENSDIDIILIIKGVENLNTLQRLQIIKNILTPNIEPRIYTPKEWTKNTTWLKQIKKEAKQIKIPKTKPVKKQKQPKTSLRGMGPGKPL